MNWIPACLKGLLTAAAAVSVVSCSTQSPGPEPSATTAATAPTQPGQQLDDYLSRLVPFGFSGAVLVAQGDEILLNKGYGLADEARGIPNTAETVFQIASVTKQFTAAAIMTLAMDGKLETSDALATFFEDVPADKQRITLRQLLTHTSGVIAGDTEYFDNNSRDEIIEMVFGKPLDFEPGTSFLYSNMGYALLAGVIEQVTGESYEDYLRSRLFLPEGMTSTGYRLSSWAPDSVAHWYAGGTDNGDQLDRPYPDWNFIGSGRIRSTTKDMFRWHRALTSEQLLSADAKKEMYTPVENDYAYGWVVSDTDHGLRIQHNGASSDGAATEFRRYVDEDVVLILFSNRDGEQMLFGNRLANHVDDIVHGVEIDPPPRVAFSEAADLEELVGIYSTEDGMEIEAQMVQGMLTVRGRGQGAVDALYRSNRHTDGDTMSAQADSALSQLMESGDTKAFGALLVNPDREERFSGYVLENRTDGESEFGAYQGLRILGTVEDWISGFGGGMTLVRLDFEKGSQVFRLHWKEGGVLAIGGSSLVEPAEFWLQPTDEPDLFGGYHLPTTTSVRVRFDRDPDGKVMALTIVSEASGDSDSEAGQQVYLRN
jgi:CubicO group peptidase (beta-lactamase class C family)